MITQKPHISLFDKSFQDSKSSQYKLYVELSSTSFKHTILDTHSNTFVGIEVYRFTDIHNDYSLLEPLKEIIGNNKIYKNEFNRITVTFVNNRSTLIPNAIFNADKLMDYHQFNFSEREEDQFYADQLINLSAYNIYSIPDFITAVFGALKNVYFKHFSSALIESAMTTAKRTKQLSSVTIHVLPASFQIVVVKNQKLNLYNSFDYQSSEDFIYYLLFVLDQLKINNEEAIITLTGEIQKNTTIYTMLYKYIQTLSFGDRPENLKFSYIFEEIPPHFHHSLFHQFLCE